MKSKLSVAIFPAIKTPSTVEENETNMQRGTVWGEKGGRKG